MSLFMSSQALPGFNNIFLAGSGPGVSSLELCLTRIQPIL